MGNDELVIGSETFHSRFILGSGKNMTYSKELITSAISDAKTELISIPIQTLGTEDDIRRILPEHIRLLPNTLGATNVDAAIQMAMKSREEGMGDMIKVEIMTDMRYMLPDNAATIAATKFLAKQGFEVLPYIYPDLAVARQLYDAGAVAIMPLASPSGSNKGLQTRDFIKMLISEIRLPIIVDAGIGRPSQACEAMEMGCAAVMANTALATAGNLHLMADSFRMAIDAGRKGYLSDMQQ